MRNCGRPRSHSNGPHSAVAGKTLVTATGASGQSGQPTGDPDTRPQNRSHDTSRLVWAKLLARIAGAFPPVCSACGGDIGSP